MKEFEMFVYASYVTDGGSKEWNCFHWYETAENAKEAVKMARAELKEEGYKNIEISDVIAVD